MAGKQIHREQHDVAQQDQRPHANTEVMRVVRRQKEESANRVIPEKAKKNDCRVKKVPVEILQDERKFGLTTIVSVGRLTHGTSRRVIEKTPIIWLSKVIAGH